MNDEPVYQASFHSRDLETAMREAADWIDNGNIAVENLITYYDAADEVWRIEIYFIM